MAAKTRETYEFVRLVENERRVGPTLASVSRHWRQEEECFLFISPHDDDIVIGGGLMIQSALKEKVPVHVAVVTDGSMGYCSLKEKDTISDIRKAETYASLKVLGVKKNNIHWLGFPDCQLSRFMGRRPQEESDPVGSHGFTGLQNAFTELLRMIRPNQVFLPTSSDLHPDHRRVHSELLISIFHAGGAIWPELGKPLERIPYIHEMAVYCNFPTAPRLRITGPKAAFLRKLQAIGLFRSQKQIKAIVENTRRGGPMEYLRPIVFQLYHPYIYRDMFDEPPAIAQMYR
ncbi:MAG: PIG-L family deacetylase [Phycisphaerae bacterium]|nr:PIG-L family deacetylase [Phycisphaerae bacterium]